MHECGEVGMTLWFPKVPKVLSWGCPPLRLERLAMLQVLRLG